MMLTTRGAVSEFTALWPNTGIAAANTLAHTNVAVDADRMMLRLFDTDHG
jgi:hypothetical protein